MQISIKLDFQSDESLQNQIFEAIRLQILSGQLAPALLLPSTRVLSEQLGVSRNTTVLAYDRLIAEDYIYSRKTIGTFVNDSLPENSLTLSNRASLSNKKINERAERHFERNPVVFTGRVQDLNNPNREKLDIDFWVGRPDPDSFPTKSWRKIINQILPFSGSEMTKYHDPAGIYELRKSIANHLRPSRGIDAEPDQVIVVNGSQEGLNIISRLLIKQNSPVVAECPCYQGAAYVFESYGAKIHPVNVDEKGLDVGLLPDEPISLAYVTPSHQYPMGATLSLKRRIGLLDWAKSTGAYILEDDYDSDFRHKGSPLTALAGQDPHGCVIYMGTFSKSLGAGLRLGYLVVPKELIEPVRMAKARIDNGSAWLQQAVLAEFISSGAYTKHLRRIRKIYLSRRDCLVESLEKYFGKVQLLGLDGGMHLIWKLPKHLPSSVEMKRISESVGVGVYTLKTGAAHNFEISEYSERTLMIGYSSTPEKLIEEGISRIAKSLENII